MKNWIAGNSSNSSIFSPSNILHHAQFPINWQVVLHIWYRFNASLHLHSSACAREYEHSQALSSMRVQVRAPSRMHVNWFDWVDSRVTSTCANWNCSNLRDSAKNTSYSVLPSFSQQSHFLLDTIDSWRKYTRNK